MDDLIAGAPDIQSAFDFCIQSKNLMAAAGMNLLKWNSNSHEIMQRLSSSTTLVKDMLPTSLATRNMEEEDETYMQEL